MWKGMLVCIPIMAYSSKARRILIIACAARRSPDDQLCNHRIIVDRDFTTPVNAAVNSNAWATRLGKRDYGAERRREVVERNPGGNTAFDGMAPQSDVVLS